MGICKALEMEEEGKVGLTPSTHLEIRSGPGSVCEGQ
jgi:hypothetical protein